MRLAVPLELDPATLDGWRPGAPVVDLAGETMGTTWHVRLAAPPAFNRTALLSAIEGRLEAILAQMSHWRADSLLGRFNRAGGGTWITLPPDFRTVLEAGLVVAERSGGAFDPAIGALVDAWGFGPEPAMTMPSPAELEQAHAVSGSARLAYDREASRLRQSGGVRLDFSGIAKGFAVDALGAVLLRHGCRHALVEIGGELLGLGLRPDGDPWWVDLETPDQGISPLRVALHQMAVATSGDYVRGRHTIDPRTGAPVEHALSVSVLHASAMWADAWATALGVLQGAEMEALASREALAVRTLTRVDGTLHEWISPALQAMIDELDEPPTG
ncbi:thiamine biosynthesis lipoprotein [Novosphingobium chloroacetimidivorans]|uniref:FAD:protein FMN transferase n=1 Tax=Novosphingobium chloroacetimidivorans TaxID=1428314 RepID=A0A7W7K8L6_9SPHN|nr:FAD:protein FMN transferase [Novosphingobium chloroacetimidivorans]MBB4857694.1 thiamine biosynthesis lipoprotein [Novosphingobium chloroacetimidivorans]